MRSNSTEPFFGGGFAVVWPTGKQKMSLQASELFDYLARAYEHHLLQASSLHSEKPTGQVHKSLHVVVSQTIQSLLPCQMASKWCLSKSAKTAKRYEACKATYSAFLHLYLISVGRQPGEQEFHQSVTMPNNNNYE